VNNGVAFLSHLNNDHGIYYSAQQMTESKLKRRDNVSKQTLADPEEPSEQDKRSEKK
jgi:hypothetical protein